MLPPSNTTEQKKALVRDADDESELLLFIRGREWGPPDSGTTILRGEIMAATEKGLQENDEGRV